MHVADFDFELPEGRIALRPARPRGCARLLCVDPNAGAPFQDRMIAGLPELLQRGDALVFNDTRVLAARLAGVRHRGADLANISLTLLKPFGANCWQALARPAKRLRKGDWIEFGAKNNDSISTRLWGHIESLGEGGFVTVAFDFHGTALENAIAVLGEMPLPPYIASRRAPDARDVDDYQTVYARESGAVAAPTAGLHFTSGLFDALDKKGIARHFVTLHVGAGTFLPVRVEDTRDHVMHGEWGEVTQSTADALNEIRRSGGKIIAVGSTALRLLESAADANGKLCAFRAETDIFITPGVAIKAVDLMLTNFHLPRSTLFMLVAAFSGLETMKRAYAHAIAQGYRFYSYGDACLLKPADPSP